MAAAVSPPSKFWQTARSASCPPSFSTRFPAVPGAHGALLRHRRPFRILMPLLPLRETTSSLFLTWGSTRSSFTNSTPPTVSSTFQPRRSISLLTMGRGTSSFLRTENWLPDRPDLGKRGSFLLGRGQWRAYTDPDCAVTTERSGGQQYERRDWADSRWQVSL